MEGFSFPAISAEQDKHCQLPFPHFASSPLWFLSSDKKAAMVDHHRCQRSRSFSSVEESLKRSVETDNQEKMDMLWEDFNEELGQIPCSRTKWREEELGIVKIHKKFDGGRRGAVDLCHAKAVHNRKPALLMVLKVLKKLFLIQKSSSKYGFRNFSVLLQLIIGKCHKPIIGEGHDEIGDADLQRGTIRRRIAAV